MNRWLFVGRISPWTALGIIALTLATTVAIIIAIYLSLAQAQPGFTPQELSYIAGQVRAEQRPADASAHVDYAWALYRKGALGTAEVEYKKALRLDPDNLAAIYGLGLIAERRGRSSAAVSLYRKALRLSPFFSEGHFHLGRIYLAQKKYDAAIRELKKVIRYEPGSADSHLLLGKAYQGKGFPGLAAAEYREALRYVPDLAEAKKGLLSLGKKWWERRD